MKISIKKFIIFMILIALPFLQITASGLRIPAPVLYPNNAHGMAPKMDAGGKNVYIVYVNPEFGNILTPSPDGRSGGEIHILNPDPNGQIAVPENDTNNIEGNAGGNHSGWQPGMMLWADIQNMAMLDQKLAMEEYLTQLHDSALSALNNSFKKNIDPLFERLEKQNSAESLKLEILRVPVYTAFLNLKKQEEARYKLLTDTGLLTEVIPFLDKNKIQKALNDGGNPLDQNDYETALAFAQALDKYSLYQHTEYQSYELKINKKKAELETTINPKAKEKNKSFKNNINQASSPDVKDNTVSIKRDNMCNIKFTCKVEVKSLDEAPEIALSLKKSRSKFYKQVTLNKNTDNLTKIGLNLIEMSNQSQIQGDLDLARTLAHMAAEAADLLVGIEPITGTSRDLLEAIFGVNLITGKPLTETERIIAIIGVGSLGVGSKVGKSIKAIIKLENKFAVLNKTTKISLNKIKNIVDSAGKIRKTFRAENVMSKHAVERLAQRNMTIAQVNKAVQHGTKYHDKLNNTVSFVIEKGFASGKTIQVVTNLGATKVVSVNRINKFKPNVKLSDGTARWVKIEEGVK